MENNRAVATNQLITINWSIGEPLTVDLPQTEINYQMLHNWEWQDAHGEQRKTSGWAEPCPLPLGTSRGSEMIPFDAPCQWMSGASPGPGRARGRSVPRQLVQAPKGAPATAPNPGQECCTMPRLCRWQRWEGFGSYSPKNSS